MHNLVQVQGSAAALRAAPPKGDDAVLLAIVQTLGVLAASPSAPPSVRLFAILSIFALGAGRLLISERR